MNGVYLDYNATTPLDPAVLEAMMPVLGDRFGNAASSHGRGRAAENAVARAREQVADLVNAPPQNIYWTSGATESINTVMKGLRGLGSDGNLVVSAGEHKAVLDSAEAVAGSTGCELRVVPLLPSGEVDLAALEGSLDSATVLVAVMAANNETGAINDIARVSEMAHAAGAFVLSDVTQQVGKLAVDLTAWDVDFSVASAHKIYGPQGVGALFVRDTAARRALTPLIHGGGHQQGLRSGTLNLPGIVGFGAAADVAHDALNSGESSKLRDLRDLAELRLARNVGPITVHCKTDRLPNTSNLRIHGVDADALIVNCPEVAISSGSACTAAVPTPSHVLLAMGLSSIEAEESVRLSVGRYTTRDDVLDAVEAIARAANRIRELSA